MIDEVRLAEDLAYWNEVAPDDEATHYCRKSKGFEYLDAGDDCDIPKPGSEDAVDVAALKARLDELEARVEALTEAGTKMFWAIRTNPRQDDDQAWDAACEWAQASGVGA